MAGVDSDSDFISGSVLVSGVVSPSFISVVAVVTEEWGDEEEDSTTDTGPSTDTRSYPLR